MATCIFCPALLDKTTKPEHILHNGLGGRKITRRVICSTCNNKFGGGIDKVFTEQFSVIRTFLQLRSGTGALPPMLKGLKAGKETINIVKGGRLKLVSKPFRITKDASGNTQLQISSENMEQIESMVPHMVAALKMSEHRLRQLLSTTGGSSVERRPDPIRIDLPSFGGLRAMRAAAKSCLVLWATLVGNEEVKGSRYDSVRRFINGEYDEFLSKHTELDSRHYEQSDQIKALYGPVFNLLYVKSNNEGRVVGHFTVYNLIAFSVVLCEEGGSPERQIALISNPLTRMWSDRAAGQLNVSFEWLSSPDYDYEDMQRSCQRMGAIMEYHLEMSRSDEFKRIIEDVLKRHGLMKKGEVMVIPEEMAYSISQEIATRVTHSVFNRPYTKPISPEQMREVFGVKPTGL